MLLLCEEFAVQGSFLPVIRRLNLPALSVLREAGHLPKHRGYLFRHLPARTLGHIEQIFAWPKMFAGWQPVLVGCDGGHSELPAAAIMLLEGPAVGPPAICSITGLHSSMSDEQKKQFGSVEGVSPAGPRRLSSHSRRSSGGSTKTNVLPRLLIASEVAETVRKSEKTIYKWAKQGRIPSVINIDGNILFDPEGTRRWIDDHRMAA